MARLTEEDEKLITALAAEGIPPDILQRQIRRLVEADEKRRQDWHEYLYLFLALIRTIKSLESDGSEYGSFEELCNDLTRPDCPPELVESVNRMIAVFEGTIETLGLPATMDPFRWMTTRLMEAKNRRDKP